jgi:septal ring factor EnvC (AmiA/AmiB activator)
MRSYRLVLIAVAASLMLSIAVSDGSLALAQSRSDAEDDADIAKERANQASGFVDAAVAQRDEIERELAATIARVNELSSQLSVVGSGLDRIAAKLGFADVEMAGIQAEIEVQAVDAYMTVVSSPSVNFVNSDTVEKALVASVVVEDVVAYGRARVDELFVKRRSLEQLQVTFLAEEATYQLLQDEVNNEVEHLAELYDRANSDVGDAVRESESANVQYQEALSSVDLARARDEERKRQEQRDTTTTSSPTTTSPSGTTPTTQPSNTTTSTTSGGGGGGPWNHPPAVEQWRSLVQQHFPASRVEEALRIMNCESNGDPNAYNPYSGASGLFQFLPSTWNSTAPNAGYAGASVFDPVANVASAAWLGARYEQLGLYFWQAWSCRRVLS